MPLIPVWDIDPASKTYREKIERWSVDVKEQVKAGLVSVADTLEEALAGEEPAPKPAPETPASIGARYEPKKKPPSSRM